MYSRFVNEPIKGNLYSVQLYSLGISEQDKCRYLFPTIANDSIVIYTPNKGDITILGFYSLDKQSITSSKYFESLIENTKSISGEEAGNVSIFMTMPCFHISEWIFDESLKDAAKLNSIFTMLFASLHIERDAIMWIDEGELIYYPIKKDDVAWGHYKAISYFTERFMTK
ncbi:MAG: hypothetical protein MJY97_04885 [Bacteroidales bacterium]|nr:hypothetical protein [Bacteroidales bacterium]